MAIMLIEDSDDTREVLSTVLKGAGYDVIACGHAAKALEMLRTGERPSMILLDLTMPEMDGFEFRSEQLDDPKLIGIPVVIVSGTAKDEEVIDRLGAVRYFNKPFDAEKILQLVAGYDVPKRLG